MCWGANAHGQLGDGTTTDRPTPTQSVEGDFGGPITGSASTWIPGIGPLWFFGDGTSGEMGDGSRDVHVTPTWAMTVSITSAGSHHVCGSGDSAATMRACWGRNQFGQLGDGSLSHGTSCTTETGESVDCATTPVATMFPSYATAGADVTCGEDLDGRMLCAGRNTSGQLGDGATHQTCGGDDCSPVPVVVEGVDHVTSVASISGTTCFLAQHHVYCVGSGARGALGDGATTHGACPSGSDAAGDCATHVVEVTGLDDAIFLAGGGHSFYAIRMDGSAVAWGANDEGQLGDGTHEDRPAPVTVLAP